MTSKRTALLEFKTHHYIHDYTKSDYYCPNCGKREVWSGGGADYYVGEAYYCTNCYHDSYLDGVGKCIDHPYVEVIDQIKSNTTYKPTTKRGC